MGIKITIDIRISLKIKKVTNLPEYLLIVDDKEASEGNAVLSENAELTGDFHRFVCQEGNFHLAKTALAPRLIYPEKKKTF